MIVGCRNKHLHKILPHFVVGYSDCTSPQQPKKHEFQHIGLLGLGILHHFVRYRSMFHVVFPVGPPSEATWAVAQYIIGLAPMPGTLPKTNLAPECP